MREGNRVRLRNMADGMFNTGIAIVVFSTEPETVLSLADRVLVMRKGEIAHEFAGEAISKDQLLAAA